jgi:class 3 adenylate cyclase
MLSETGVPARLWRAPVPEKRRLSERVYSAMSSRIVSIWGFCLPRARGIASPSPAKPCPGNTDGVVASGHRRIDETSVCRGRQPICGRRSAQSPVAPDKLLLRTIACRAASVVQAVGCPGWVINGPRAASELGPLIPGQRTCGDYFSMSVSCQQPTSPRVGIPSNPSYSVLWVGLRAMVQERPVRVERRLSAILAADVAGYSRLMHNDEEATHAKLITLLADGVTPVITEHGGRIVKNTGDGFLAEFPSAVEAVRAAVQFQTRIKELTISEVEDRRIAFRVGVNIGDVIVEPHDIFGDGVNVAARLESIAEPGGICISSAAYDQVRGKVRVEFADLGEQNLKNIARPVRAYAVVWDGPSAATQALRVRPSSLSAPRLSIVVLPFANLSGDPEQDYFVDGVTESLTADLSRISGSFVIGRHTAFTYKGKALDLKKIGRELNVRYALEGSVQRSGNRFG